MQGLVAWLLLLNKNKTEGQATCLALFVKQIKQGRRGLG
jgi:hypothetical protein